MPVVVVSDRLAAQCQAAAEAAATAGPPDGAADLSGLLRRLDVGADGATATCAPAGQLAGAAEQPAALKPGIHFVSAADYFGRVWGHVPTVADAAESITAALQEASAGGAGTACAGGEQHAAHLTGRALQQGLAKGELLQASVQPQRP